MQLNIVEVDNNFEFTQLSIDHKPNLDSEKERIESRGGQVDKYRKGLKRTGPYRVWVKGEGHPGLAMSRSIGDFVAGSVGVTSTPGKLVRLHILQKFSYMI